MPQARNWRRHRTRESRGLAIATASRIPECCCSESFPWLRAVSAEARRGSRWGATRVPSSVCMETRPRQRASWAWPPPQAPCCLRCLARQRQPGARGGVEAAWQVPWVPRRCWRGHGQTSAPDCPWKLRRYRWGCRWCATKRKASYSHPRLRRPAAPLASAPAALPGRRTCASVRTSYRVGSVLGPASHLFADPSQ